MAALKDEYSRLGDAMEKTQGSAMQARLHCGTELRNLPISPTITIP